MQDLTPYAAAQVTNIVLSRAGQDRTVTPQYMYGLARKETIAVVTGSKPVQFRGDEFKAWLDRYVSGQNVKARADYDKLAEQYL